MSRFPDKLSRLRVAYVVYFAVLVLVDVVAAWRMAGGGGFGGGVGRPGLTYGAFLAIYLPVSAVLFALGLWLIGTAARRKNWARVVLLVVGWLTVIDALFSLLFTAGTPQFARWLGGLVPGVDWARAILVDRIKDLLSLAYWAYLVYVLQFDPDVKGEFATAGPPAQGQGSPDA